MKMLDRGMKWLNKMATDDRVAGLVVATYYRGNDSVQLPITLLRSNRDQTDERGFKIDYQEQDVRILVANLVINTVAIEPRNKDRIEYQLNGKTVKLEVLPSENEPCWRYTDQLRTAIRVKTKAINW